MTLPTTTKTSQVGIPAAKRKYHLPKWTWASA
jgi:hypothetical protein